jgi:hypothetical protein
MSPRIITLSHKNKHNEEKSSKKKSTSPAPALGAVSCKNLCSQYLPGLYSSPRAAAVLWQDNSNYYAC